MNPETLVTGRLLHAKLVEVEEVVRSMVDASPVRCEDAIVHADRAARALREARVEVGVVVGLLARDVAP